MARSLPLRVCALAAALLFVVPAASGQSDTCQARNDTEVTCDDGFTCAYIFPAPAPYERFTFQIVLGNTIAETDLLVEVNGDYQIVREGTTVIGAVMSWTPPRDPAADFIYRVVNINTSAGNVTTRIACADASTETTAPSAPGDDTIPVSDMTPFAVGDSVLVAPGTPTEEGRVIVGFGSLVLDAPLEFAHATGETVVSIGPGPLTTADEPDPSDALARLDAAPNPARATSLLTLSLRAPGTVSVEIYDTLGRQLARVFDGPLAEGSHDLSLDLAHLPPGLYIVRATASNGATMTSLSRRITVVR